MLVLLMGGIYEVRHSGGLSWHDMRTKFHDDRFMHSSNIKVITSRIWEVAVLVLLVGGIYEVCRRGGLRWHDIYVCIYIYISCFVTVVWVFRIR
jgi:hypothetical protein